MSAQAGTLTLASPPEMGWREGMRTDAQATADTELLACPWPVEPCPPECEQGCDECAIEATRNG